MEAPSAVTPDPESMVIVDDSATEVTQGTQAMEAANLAVVVAASPSPSSDIKLKSVNSKLCKIFALNEKVLFMDLSADELEKVLDNGGRKKKSADETEFEIIKPSSAFVTAAITESQRCLTENLGPTFSTSGDPRVDFFFHVMEQTEPAKALKLLESSWLENDLHTLKLVASLRDIQDGKGIRHQFQVCLYWLYQSHPKTLYENLPILIQFGYWKDALHLLMTLCFEGFIHPYFTADDGIKNGRTRARSSGRAGNRKRSRPSSASAPKVQKPIKPRQSDDDKRIYNKMILQHYKVDDDIRKVSTKQMANLRIQYAREQFNTNLKYRAFHIRIAKIFAQQLALDFHELNRSKTKLAGAGDSAVVTVTDENETDKKSGSKLNISLAGKWAPTLEGHFDRYTLIATSISLEFAKLLNKDDVLTKDKVEVAAYLARKFYNKQACIPLRASLEIPEGFMSRNEWSLVNYGRVPAKCMKLNKEHFIAHDEQRFEAYLKKDDTKVAGATLKPIEIIKAAMSLVDNPGSEAERIVTEKQWISLTESIKAKGGAVLTDAIAVCDVSGSMLGDPMTAAMGLTLLTMNMSSPPWNSICVTFHETPTIHNVPAELSLLEKVDSLKTMKWGGTTNFQAVFKQILDIGIKNKLTPDQMPKVLLVFTDMEFNEAFPGSTETNFENAKSLFSKNGYNMPTMVFWNLRDTAEKKSTPVQVDERGTLLISGWSGQLLAFIMRQKDLSSCSPWSFVQELIGKEKYNGLKIYD